MKKLLLASFIMFGCVSLASAQQNDVDPRAVSTKAAVATETPKAAPVAAPTTDRIVPSANAVTATPVAAPAVVGNKEAYKKAHAVSASAPADKVKSKTQNAANLPKGKFKQ